MDYLAALIIGIYVLISSFHFYWGFGGRLGIESVIPTKEGIPMLNPSKSLTILVGFLVLGFAWVFYFLYFDDYISSFVPYMAWGISGLFILRAIGEFNAVGFFKKIKNTVFAKADTLFFSPLCLFTGLISALITYQASL